MSVATVRTFIDLGWSGEGSTAGLKILDEFYRNDIIVIMTVNDAINDRV